MIPDPSPCLLVIQGALVSLHGEFATVAGTDALVTADRS
jgi:hypothetical protein